MKCYTHAQKKYGKIKERIECYISNVEEQNFKINIEKLKEKYELTDMKGEKIEKIEEKEFALSAINGLLEYIKQTQKMEMEHIRLIKIYSTTKYMSLDISARRNLELTERMRDKGKRGTLLWVLDKTSTSMGGRMLRRWINDPLIEVNEINERLEAVKELKGDMILKGDIIDGLKKIFDIERIARKNSVWKRKCKRHVIIKIISTKTTRNEKNTSRSKLKIPKRNL